MHFIQRPCSYLHNALIHWDSAAIHRTHLYVEVLHLSTECTRTLRSCSYPQNLIHGGLQLSTECSYTITHIMHWYSMAMQLSTEYTYMVNHILHLIPADIHRMHWCSEAMQLLAEYTYRDTHIALIDLGPAVIHIMHSYSYPHNALIFRGHAVINRNNALIRLLTYCTYIQRLQTAQNAPLHVYSGVLWNPSWGSTHQSMRMVSSFGSFLECERQEIQNYNLFPNQIVEATETRAFNLHYFMNPYW